MGAALNMTVLAGHFDWATATATLPGLGLALIAIVFPHRWIQVLTPILMTVLLLVYFIQYFSVLQA